METQLKYHQIGSKFLMFIFTTIDPGRCKVTGGSLERMINSGPENFKKENQIINKLFMLMFIIYLCYIYAMFMLLWLWLCLCSCYI